ncbi:MAG: ABC transporter substrate-binding protein [Alphaproteobacteria bacterium]
MRRRDFVVAAGGALAGTLAGQARAATKPLVAYLGIASRTSDQPFVDSLRRGLQEVGRTPDVDITLVDRYADGDLARFPALLDDVVAQGVAVIVVPGIAAALAVRERAPQIPVVAMGLPSTVLYPDLFQSLHRPGGSVTGFSPFGEDLADKRVELLRELVPGLRTVAILNNSIDPLYRSWGEKTEQAARAQGLAAVRLGVESKERAALDKLMRAAKEAGAEGMIIVRDFLTHLLQQDIAQKALAMGIATMAEQRNFVEIGGLMSYGADHPAMFRRAGAYVDDILDGADPADMPIQLATQFELVVNRRTAEKLDLEIPRSILLRADEVIE